ncbi:MAG TPA: thymidylate synthase [Verrucomicrobiae bacterium]|nr:thymidylate synthase [Verrucomicrobiae bacterium]
MSQQCSISPVDGSVKLSGNVRNSFPSNTQQSGGFFQTVPNPVRFQALGQTWVNLVNRTLHLGAEMGVEGLELLGVEVGFGAVNSGDEVIDRWGDCQMIAQMERVFFTEGANPLGHSYAKLLRGPEGRQDLGDVISLLRQEPWSKRAVVTFCGDGNGKVPCLNTLQFLVRHNALHTMYFARGQDAFRKFYADGLCVGRMARQVAEGLGLKAGDVRGWIGSSHIYHRDRPAIEQMLDGARDWIGAASEGGH